ncbi:hypothetical protein TNCV_2492691 [Trichonephila clavipes]|uniref:Uncharacterized protein n=1 Tax=Trichonephila clavipes TaxID=2585209 RepID=A0A8X6S1Z6_TRICX|nr:hypothetical protein TNCV_2492691 [Trichonephila clavipes]
MHPKSTSELQQVIVTETVQSCGRLGHSTADSDRQKTIRRVQANPVCWRCQLERRIAFLSLIGTQTVPGSPQFGICRTSWSHYRFSSSLKGHHNGSLKIQSLFGLSRSPYIYISNNLSPNHPSVVSCSSAAPVGLSPFHL